MDGASFVSALSEVKEASFARPPERVSIPRRAGGRKARFAESVRKARTSPTDYLWDMEAVVQNQGASKLCLLPTPARRRRPFSQSARVDDLAAESSCDETSDETHVGLETVLSQCFGSVAPVKRPSRASGGFASGRSAHFDSNVGSGCSQQGGVTRSGASRGEEGVTFAASLVTNEAALVASLSHGADPWHDEELSKNGIRTGDDAINFFSSPEAARSQLKFVHLVNVSHSETHAHGATRSEATVCGLLREDQSVLVSEQQSASLRDDPSFAVEGIAPVPPSASGTQPPEPPAGFETGSFFAGVSVRASASGIDYRPYDLVALNVSGASLSRAKCEYYSMSSEGLVHMQPGEPSEFVPLTQWMRDAACFNMLTAIPFFRNYLRNKCFAAWRSNVSFLLYKRQRSKLAERLFLGMQSFARPLLDLKKHMQKLHTIKLLEVGVRTFEVQTFVEKQLTARQEALKELDHCMEQAAASVHAICKEISSISPSNGCDDALARAKHASREEENLVTRVVERLEEMEKPKSMASLKQLELERRARLRRAAFECSLLPEFVRLCDYVAVEALVDLMIGTWGGFLAELVRPRRQSGLLETTIRFSEEGSSFLPTCQAIQQVLSTTAEQLIGALGGVMRILYLRPLARFAPAHTAAGAQRSGPNVPDIVRCSASFKSTCRLVNSKVEQDFKKAGEYVSLSFDKVWPIYDYSRRWDFEAYKRQAHTVASLKKETEKVSGWEKELEKMRTRQTCGMLEVESRKLRQTLIPMTCEKMEALKDLVKDLSRAKCKDQRHKYKSAIAKISPRPSALTGFTVLLERIEEQQVQARSLLKHTQIVEQMYQMLAYYEAKVADADLVQLDELRTVQARYAQELEGAHAFRAERLPEMQQQLEPQIAKFDEQLKVIALDLQKGAFVSVDRFEEPAKVLRELELVRAKLEALLQQDHMHKKQQKLFSRRKFNADQVQGVRPDSEQGAVTPTQLQHHFAPDQVTQPAQPRTTKTALDAAQESFDRVCTLWTMVERLDEDYQQWVHEDFLAQDVAAIERDVKLYQRGCANLSRKMKNDVVAKLASLTTELIEMIPLMKQLAQPELNATHWARIFERLAEPAPQHLDFSLDQLLKAGLTQHKEFVSEVLADAQHEALANEVKACLETLLTRLTRRAKHPDRQDDDSGGESDCESDAAESLSLGDANT